MRLKGKNILVGVTGSIAAYKAAILVRHLVKEGASVRVVMTAAAKEFITPLTMATLAKNPIYVEFFNPENGDWHSHVSLGEWADCFVVAPATANTIAKMAYGIADNLLLTTYLSARCPVMVAPAMDLDMYSHPTTGENLDRLRKVGVEIVEPEEGELASGLVGKGRMAEPEYIGDRIADLLARGGTSNDEPLQPNVLKKTLNGSTLLVTAGATIEPIDPVRYITNHSTGKMGYAIAAELAARGARVVLISGRTSLAVPEGVERVDVLSAEEMYEAARERWSECDGGVMCAAVADYTPAEVSTTKVKKGDGDLTLSLRRTHDIAAELGAVKGDRLLVGFALETDHEEENARAKLQRKNFDLVVLNSLQDSGAGFGGDTNKVSFVTAAGVERFPLEEKSDVARRIADFVEQQLGKRGDC